jgi:hypothetical protein
MGKVIHFLPEGADMESQAKYLLELIQQGKIEKLAIIAQNKDGYIETGYNGCDVGDKQYLCSHMQVDINFEIVRINADQIVEIIND